MAQSPRSLSKDATIRIKAQDQASATLKRVQGSLRAFATALIARQVGSALENVGKRVLAVAENAGKMALEFDDAWSKIGVLTGKLGMSLDDARKHVLDLGGATGQAPKELADALYFVASAGLKAKQVMPVLDVAAKGAAEGLGSVQDVARTLVTSLNAYTGTSLTAIQTMNIFQTAAKLSTAEVQDFATGLGPVVGVAAQAGVSLQTLAAAIAQATHAGLPFDRAVTGFRFLISSLEAPTNAAKDALKSYGFTLQEIHNELSKPGGLQHIMQTLAERFDLTSVKGREAWRAVTGGIRGAIVATTLIGKQTDSANRFMRKLNETGTKTSGVFDKAFEAIKKRNPALALAMVQEKLHGIEIELANNFLPVWIKFLAQVNKLLDRFKALSPATQHLIAQVIVFGGVFLIAAGKVLKLFGALEGMIALLKLTDISFIAMTATMSTVLIVIAALAAAAFVVITNWSKFRGFFIDLWVKVRAAALAAFNTLRDWWEKEGPRLIAKAQEFGQALARFIVTAFQSLAIVVPPVVEGFGAFLGLMLSILTPVLKVGQAILKILGPAFRWLGPFIKDTVTALLALKVALIVSGWIGTLAASIKGLLVTFGIMQAATVGAGGQLALFGTQATGLRGVLAGLGVVGTGVAIGAIGLLAIKSKMASDEAKQQAQWVANLTQLLISNYKPTLDAVNRAIDESDVPMWAKQQFTGFVLDATGAAKRYNDEIARQKKIAEAQTPAFRTTQNWLMGITTWGNNAADAVRNYLRNLRLIHSPAGMIPKGGDFNTRQAGGPVRAGMAYTINERGPETFIPAVSGRIAPHGETVPASSGRVQHNNFYIYGGAMDEKKLADYWEWMEIKNRGWG